LIGLVIVVPVLTFTAFEIGNLRQNEKVIQDIYKNQLDAILFSINQYSDDVLANLASRIENNSNNFRPDTRPELNILLSEIPSVLNLLQFNKNLAYISSVSAAGKDTLSEIVAGLRSDREMLDKLETYLRGGYRKLAAIGNIGTNLQCIVFLTTVDDQIRINVLMIDPEKFVSQLLDPKIQEIAKDQFDIVAFRSGEETPFYTSNKQNTPGKTLDRRPFWLLENYLMGIELRDITIADLARQRSRRNLILISIMDVLLLFGAGLIFRNVSKQVELSQLKSDFVASVSHEIRTPLALISMYIETLEMGRVKSAEKISEYYTVILNETSRLSGIVNRILNFSQIEGNKRKYTFGKTNMNEIVENASLTFRHTLESKGFHCELEPESGLPEINADKEAITDSIMNLIDNAMKYSSDNKDIIIRTGKSDGYVYVEVEDHGIGISDKDKKFIFDKFYRVTQKDLANKVKGSGLGLAIVKHITDAHNGKIFVKSVPGTGSLFRLLFPVK
jgi:two-component system phosphate regulon sensor histidine kinase PhoR